MMDLPDELKHPNGPLPHARKRSIFRRVLSVIRQLLLLAIGTAFFVTAVRCLFKPNQLLAGGVAGTSLLFYNLFRFPVGMTIAVLNLPIFLLGYRVIGRRFTLYSALAVVGTWLLIDYVPLPVLTSDPMLAGVFGGVLAGIGTSLGLKSGGSLGGLDILGTIMNRRFGVGVGEVLLMVNGCIVVASGLIGSPELAMYTLVGIFASGKTVDAILAPRRRKAFVILTRRPDRIRETVLVKMDRGMTVFRGEGAFTGREIVALLCVVTRGEIKELEEIVKQEDPDAFQVVLEASEVVGSFRSSHTSQYLKQLQQHIHPS